jgi:hypothetical protein
MADTYNNPKSYAEWGDALDTAERENKNPSLIEFAERSYRREAEHAADEAVALVQRSGRTAIPDIWRTFEDWDTAVKRFGELDIPLSRREAIDAEIDAANKLYRIANFTRAAWEDKHGALSAGDTRRGPTLRVRRLKAAPTRYVRLNGVKIPRSKS